MPNSPLSFLPATPSADTAWLFPGQGAQEVGMGADLYGGSAAAREVFDTADRVLGYSLTRVCTDGPEELLRDTLHAQPAILTVSIAALAAAVESGAVDRSPAYVAGHSLGEYSALISAGALSLEDGLRLIRERARLMAEAGAAVPGTLAAVIGLTEEQVLEVCSEAGVDPCNFNLPGQTVIGGTRDAVAKAMALAKARGAQRAVELNVSGAFHSRLMAPAVPGLVAAIGAATVQDAVVPLVANSSAEALSDSRAIRRELAEQVARPVRWHQSVSLMAAAGVTRFIEFGPGKVLTGLVRRIAPGAALLNVSRLEDTQRGVSLAGTS